MSTFFSLRYGVSFELAEEVFDDPWVLTSVDRGFEYGEERLITYKVSCATQFKCAGVLQKGSPIKL